MALRPINITPDHYPEDCKLPDSLWDIKNLKTADVTPRAYFVLSVATESMPSFVPITMDEDSYALVMAAMRLVHGVLGIGSELRELLEAIAKQDPVNVMEEIGDLEWYAACCARMLYPNMNALLAAYDGAMAAPLPGTNLQALASDMDDGMKRFLFRRTLCGDPAKNLPGWDSPDGAKDLNVIRKALSQYWPCAAALAKEVGYDIAEVRRVNLVKLHERFGARFNSYRTMNRDLDRERAVLETAKQAAPPAPA